MRGVALGPSVVSRGRPRPSLSIRTRNEKFRPAFPGHRRATTPRLEHHMLASFTTLAYAFCAAVLPAGATELVAVGYISLDRCFVQVETGESTIKIIDGHDILIEIVPDGAVVGVDALRFFIPKAPSV